VTALVGILLSLLCGLVYARTHRREDEGRISQATIAGATSRERIHRERLERLPGNDALTNRIRTSGRFLRGTDIGGRRTA
jgi:hypothetical protein